MKRLTLILLVLTAGCASPEDQYTLLIKNVTIVDPLRGVEPDQTVGISDGNITLVMSSANDLQATNVIDGTGKYLIPGLWDAHVHFAFEEELAPAMFSLFLRYGITSVRDTGGKIDFVKKWKDKALADPDNAPRVMIAGPLLDGLPNVYDGSSPMTPELSVGLATVEDVEAKVLALIEQDVDLLKAYEMLTPAQFEKVTALGKQHGLKVTGHVPLSMDMTTASDAGLNSLEHMRNLEIACASDADKLWEQRRQLLAEGKNDKGSVLRSRIHTAQRQHAVENYDEDRAQQVLGVLAKNDTWQIPTIGLSTASVTRFFAESDYQESFRYMPEVVDSAWRAGIAEYLPTELTEFQKSYAQYLKHMVQKIHRAGIPIMAGTDCPIFYLTPGRSLHHELAMLVECGLSNQEALQAATTLPARYFGMESSLGQVRAGMLADLVILSANPLDDISNTLAIETVIRNGRIWSAD